MTRQYQPHLNADQRDDAGGENRIDRRLALSSAVRCVLRCCPLFWSRTHCALRGRYRPQRLPTSRKKMPDLA